MAYGVNGACVNIEVLVMGPIDNNVYVISDGEATFVVDPTCDEQRILKVVGNRELQAIVLTHAHWDHVGAAYALHTATGAPLVASSVDAPVIAGQKSFGTNHRRFKFCAVDRKVHDGDMVEIGAMRWKVIATPGHTPGSMCLYLDPKYGSMPDGLPVLISGDTLFAGTHGRTDFEEGNPADMRRSLKRLASLPDETIVLPGHNSLTTIGREKIWLSGGGVVR